MANPRLEVLPDVWIDSRRALWLARLRLLVVADLHWGYVETHRARGHLLPAWGDAEIATRLHGLITDYRPAEMIWLGDSLHAIDGRTAAEAFLRTTPVPVALVSGNHDSRWPLAGECASLGRDAFFFHHGHRTLSRPPNALEVVGHYHPALAWHDGAGGRLKLPALVVSPRRLVLPAFSPWAAGTPWQPDAPDEIIYAIGTKRIFTLSPGARHKDSCEK